MAVFEAVEVYNLWNSGLAHGNWVAVALGLAVLFLLLAFELAEHAAIRRDLDLGREIAEWLLPQAPPRVPGFEIAFGTRRAAHVGSDYFNAFPRWPDASASARPHVFIVMADVAGVGMQGALLMATFQASLRALVDARVSLADLSAQLSRWSWDRSIGGKHFTMAFFADFDTETGAMTYVSAGHQPPVIRRVRGGLERLDVGGFPLGALADSTYETGDRDPRARRCARRLHGRRGGRRGSSGRAVRRGTAAALSRPDERVGGGGDLRSPAIIGAVVRRTHPAAG